MNSPRCIEAHISQLTAPNIQALAEQGATIYGRRVDNPDILIFMLPVKEEPKDE